MTRAAMMMRIPSTRTTTATPISSSSSCSSLRLSSRRISWVFLATLLDLLFRVRAQQSETPSLAPTTSITPTLTEVPICNLCGCEPCMISDGAVATDLPPFTDELGRSFQGFTCQSLQISLTNNPTTITEQYCQLQLWRFTYDTCECYDPRRGELLRDVFARAGLPAAGATVDSVLLTAGTAIPTTAPTVDRPTPGTCDPLALERRVTFLLVAVLINIILTGALLVRLCTASAPNAPFDNDNKGVMATPPPPRPDMEDNDNERDPLAPSDSPYLVDPTFETDSTEPRLAGGTYS